MSVVTLNAKGKELSQHKIKVTGVVKTHYESEPIVSIAKMYPWPKSSRYALLTCDESTSSLRPYDAYYQLDIQTGIAKQFLVGQNFFFSDDGKYYLHTDKQLTKFGKDKHVWETQLYRTDNATGNRMCLTHGTAFVEIFDWRKLRSK